MPDNAGNRAPHEAGPYVQSGHLFSGSDAAIDRSIAVAKENAETERKNSAERRLDVYQDDWQDLLRGRIAGIYERPNAIELYKVLDTSNNPLKRIVDSISTIYDRPAGWKFATENPLWGEILENAHAAVVQPELNRLVNLLNECLVYVRPNREGWLSFHLITPDQVTVWQDPDDPTQPLACQFTESLANTPGAMPIQHLWTRGMNGDPPLYRKLDLKGRIIQELANPYVDERGASVIPVTAYHRRWPTSSFWDSCTGEDLYEVTMNAGLWETWINHLMRTDSIRQKWASGLLDLEGEQVGGPLSLLQFRSPDGTPVNIGEFSSQSDWKGLGDQVMRKLQNVLNANGMSIADFQVSGDVQSGFSLRVRKAGLTELRERQIPLYRTWDRRFYATCAAVWNLERRNEKQAGGILGKPELPWPSSAKPITEYSDVQTAMTVSEKAEELAYRESRMKLGLDSPLTIYFSEHPGVSQAEAEEAIRKNGEDTKRLRTAEHADPVVTTAAKPPA